MKSDVELCVGSPDRPTEADQKRMWQVKWIGIATSSAAMLSIVAVGVSSLIFEYRLLWALAAIVSLSLLANFGFWLFFGCATKAAKWDRAFWSALARLPDYARARAVRRTALEDCDAYLEEIECHEAHLPGDCPLCGAD